MAREKARKEFYTQYYKHLNRGNSPPDEKTLDRFKKAMIEYPYEIERVIKPPAEDKTEILRRQYLQTQKQLPDFIRKAIQNRRLVMAMTEHEFFITVGDTAHLQRKTWHDNRGNSRVTYFEKRVRGVPYGRGVKFVNGFLEGFSVIN
ncbi:MAG: hypothetical protein ACE5NG_04680 [bacterium]